jgi:hypothetical protein
MALARRQIRSTNSKRKSQVHKPPLLTKEENIDREHYKTNHEIQNWKEHTRLIKGIKWKSKKSKS